MNKLAKNGRTSVFLLIIVSCIMAATAVVYYCDIPTGSVKVERSPPERKVVSSSHSRVTKDLKNGNRYTQLSTKLESDIDKPER